ncbi:MAG: undecaprenyl-phosphate alpha-N-acetylglucosaminyl 1-phosphate transferase [Planctomycetaceae bacterium]|jgi:UDP-GlcNAc:undecaprenyl-phosphate GlcNAc-1-phosphate transferase|nr:undecaprenyl-phosphate alpha-N-acetylglucosaminyl 1-phosphate transferase [Planctomycetaceae bacterium]MDP7276328.1 MraY family glycosyltransferase [Planctomycetaceae bacterium]
MLTFVLACVVPPFLLAVTTTALVRRFAPGWGLLDRPGPRKVHEVVTPLGGGVAVWLSVVIPLGLVSITACGCLPGLTLDRFLPAEVSASLDFVQIGSRLGLLWWILGGATLLALVGLIDDFRNLPWLPRLAIQLLVAVGLVLAGVRGTVFLPWPWIGFVATVLWILVLVNAFNFLDNMDGLSPGIALIAASLFAVVLLTGTAHPHWLVAGVLLVLAGSLAGFLCHNWPPAKIFLGDAGSYFIGLLLAALTVVGTFYEGGTGTDGRHVILAPLFILAIPLYDFTSVMLIRLGRGHSPFRPDKNHFSHRLVELGLSRRNTVLTIHLATLLTGLGGVLLYRVTDWTAALLILVLISCVLGIIAILETVGRRAQNDDVVTDD